MTCSFPFFPPRVSSVIQHQLNGYPQCPCISTRLPHDSPTGPIPGLTSDSQITFLSLSEQEGCCHRGWRGCVAANGGTSETQASAGTSTAAFFWSIRMVRGTIATLRPSLPQYASQWSWPTRQMSGVPYGKCGPTC